MPVKSTLLTQLVLNVLSLVHLLTDKRVPGQCLSSLPGSKMVMACDSNRHTNFTADWDNSETESVPQKLVLGEGSKAW